MLVYSPLPVLAPNNTVYYAYNKAAFIFRQKAYSYRGAYRVPLFNLSVGMCVFVCDVEFVVFTDCESCSRPISTNLVSMEAGEYG